VTTSVRVMSAEEVLIIMESLAAFIKHRENYEFNQKLSKISGGKHLFPSFYQ